MVNFIDCGRNEFIQHTKDKRVYCFGAGTYFDFFLAEQYGVLVEAVIDNYRYMDKAVKVENIFIPIISVETFERIYTSDCVVVITCLAFDEILEQLDRIERFQGMECYISVFIHNYTETIDIIMNSIDKEEVIPKKIHYCWFGGSEIPDSYKKNIDSWKDFCPDYELIRWDETNYDVYKNQYISQAYKNEKWAFVTDYARVDILYNEGGLYFDTDVEIIKSFDSFLGWRMFCGFESIEVVNWGLGFGSIAKESILRRVLDVYEHMSFINEDGEINSLTCPIIQSKVMRECGFEMNGQFQVKDGVAIYPKEFFSPYDYIREFGRITKNTHSIHHYSASWQDINQLKLRTEFEKKIAKVKNRNTKSDIWGERK